MSQLASGFARQQPILTVRAVPRPNAKILQATNVLPVLLCRARSSLTMTARVAKNRQSVFEAQSVTTDPLQQAALYDNVIRMASLDSTTHSIVSIRVNAEQRVLLKAAAEQHQTNLSDFVRSTALEAAEAAILQRSIVTISAKDWESFEAWLDRPAERIPALAQLMSRVSSREP